MPKVALTSVVAGAHTVKTIEYLIDHGKDPVIVTEPSNSRRLNRLLSHRVQAEIIEIPSFQRPNEAVRSLVKTLTTKNIRLSNWINVTDQTTAFFLKSCDLLGIRFSFRDTYERCRNKSAARTRLASRGVDDVHFAIHDLNKPTLPAGF